MTVRAPLILVLAMTLAALAVATAQVRLPPPASRPIVIFSSTLIDGSRARNCWGATEIGQVKTGLLADLRVLDADPIGDITDTRRIAAVIRGGALYEP